LAEVAAARGRSPAEVALAWLRSLSPVIVPLPGATRVETAASAARAARLVLDGNDLAALAAMQRSPSRRAANAAKLSETKLPVMVLIGEGDTLVGSGDKLAASIPGAKLVKVPGDHLTAVGAPELKRAAIDFLAKHSPVTAAR
jgi:pimeloyl-ACP methyl ester carboxylesterase